MATCLWLLIHLVVLSTISVSGKVFESIDCGASGNYTDDNNIMWTGDDDLISNGVSYMVNSSVSPVFDTLRAFNIRKRNCYSIEVEKGEKVLVRVSFFYGNYDGKESAPTFALHFDGNFWINVSTTEPKVYEAIYVVKWEVISVCVSRIHEDQFPFISTLEVRSVDSEAYSGMGTEYALLTNIRIGYGLTETIRDQAGPFDRWWVPGDIGSGVVRLLNNTFTIDVNLFDNPPTAVVESAIATTDTNAFIILSLPTIDYPIDYPMYINWYFTELQVLGPEEYRSFNVYKDNISLSSSSVVPLFGEVSEYVVTNLFVTTDTNFYIIATHDSTHPPLINAIEYFSVSHALTNGTNNNDVEGLDSLKRAFEVLKDWGGDPCLPAPYSWDWIECNDDTRPRVTSLNLNGYNLVGSLPDFRNMDALEIIDLHNNSLTGSLPDFLGRMKNLKELNLAYNQFSGSIPSSLLTNSQLNLSYSGNLLLMSNSNKKKTGKLSMMLAITVPVFFIF